jgi:PAS domain S-box-containing protein
MEILELNGKMREWFPHINGKRSSLCYRVFPDPARQNACPRCPVIKTFQDGRKHTVILKIRNGNGIRKVRAIALPVRDAQGKVVAAIERMENLTGKPHLGEESKSSEGKSTGVAAEHPGVPRNTLERELSEETKRLGALLETTNALTSSLDSKTTLRIIGDKAKELTGADGCTIYLLDTTGRKLKPIFCNEAALADEVLAFELKLGEGLSGKVVESGVAQIVNHAERDRNICVQIPGTPEAPECLLSAPLINKEKVVGVMTLNREGEREFHQRDLELLTIFANQISDIVESARLLSLLKESEERYRGIFENSMDILYIADIKGKILEINPVCQKILNLEREKIVGQRLDSMFVNPAERATLNKHIRQAGFVKDMEAQIRTADSEILDVLETCTVLKGPDGTVIGYTGIIRDITERKKLQEELIQSQKLEAIGRLAGGVAHDFNNLLSGILGYASYAKSLVQPDSKIWRSLNLIQNSSEKAADLTRQLLGFSRRATYQNQTVDVNALISEVLKLMGRTINENVVVKQKLSPNLYCVEADVTQIQQAILNLCLNANDAMEGKGGILNLETRNVFFKKGGYSPYQLNLPPGQYVQITINDTGLGMDEVTMRKMFDPFFTTKKVGKGTGLGLALAYGIVKSHGGNIVCSSTPDHGSIFRIYLPVAKEKVCSAKSKRRTKSEDLPAGHETVLVVDDEEVIRHLAKDVLKSLGYQIIVASSGKEAIRLYEQRSADVALVILDMIMPQMTGEKIYAEIKKINPDVKIILSSGYSRNGATTRLLKEGAAAFVQKPYTMGNLARVVRKILDA